MKKIELAKTSKNEGALLDIFQRAKRAGKIFHLGFSEKKTLLVDFTTWDLDDS